MGPYPGRVAPDDVPPAGPDAARDAGVRSPVEQDYLKVIYAVREWSDEPVTTSLLAQRLGVSASTASETVRRLGERGLVAHERYRPVELTERGRAEALRVVRRHRLLETYLVTELGFTWDEVHQEADVLEHVVSDLLLDRIDARLGRPRRDPHGDPIPGADGSVERPDAQLLSSFDVGARGAVARISDDDPDLLRWCTEVGLELDVVVTVADRKTFAGTTTVLVHPGAQTHRVEVGDLAAAALRLVALET